jgi:hypothetical protein
MNLTTGNTQFAERRAKPRINCNYPAIVKGRDTLGKKFAEKGRVISLSSSGIFMVTNRSIQNNAEVHVKIAFPTGSLEWGTFKLATVGVVVRTDFLSERVIGVAIKFQHYRFL